MRIKEVINGAVILALDPGECLMLAEACGRAAEALADEKRHNDDALYSMAAAQFEALALLGSVTNYVAKYDKTLAEWTLPIVRREWGFVATHQEVAK